MTTFKSEQTALAKARAQLHAIGVWTGVRRCKDSKGKDRYELLYEVPFEQRRHFLDPNVTADDQADRPSLARGRSRSSPQSESSCDDSATADDGSRESAIAGEDEQSELAEDCEWDIGELNYDDSFAY